MQYTLDSFKQVKEALIKSFPEKKIEFETAILTSETEKFKISNSEVYFFGVLTVGTNCKANLYLHNKKSIEVDSNSQIIDIFQKIEYLDSNDVVISDGSQESHFRGFELILSD